MIRIIAGDKKGLKLEVPPSAKPITDRIKTSIFDLTRDFIKDSIVLDLFSGSGNFAIEALSRGAKSAYIVEMDDKAIQIIKFNIKKVNYVDKTNIYKTDVLKFLKNNEIKFDLIMLDPPFPMNKDVKKTCLNQSIKKLNNDGLLIFRYPKIEKYINDEIEGNIIYKKNYGISEVLFINKNNT